MGMYSGVNLEGLRAKARGPFFSSARRKRLGTDEEVAAVVA